MERNRGLISSKPKFGSKEVNIHVLKPDIIKHGPKMIATICIN